MGWPTHSSEYGTIVAIFRPFNLPPGYTYISTTTPWHYQKICRNHTLARGRILCEARDSGRPLVVGYAVPDGVARLARNFKDGVFLDHWDELRPTQTRTLKYTQAILAIKFPRMPALDVREIAEKAERTGWKDDKEALEAIVVEYVKHEWTGFDFKMEGCAMNLPDIQHPYVVRYDVANKEWRKHQLLIHQKEDQVFEEVKPRMREILKDWMPEHMSDREQASFMKKHKINAQEQEMPARTWFS
jgi:hypothetical protein